MANNYSRDERRNDDSESMSSTTSKRGKGNDKTGNSNRRNSSKSTGQRGRSRGTNNKNGNRGGKDTSPRRNRGPQAGASFYEKYPELIAAVGKLPFPYKPGDYVNLTSYASMIGSTSTPSMSLAIPNFSYKQQVRTLTPGVLALGWVPSVGTSLSTSDPASQASFAMWSLIRSAFSGTLEADGTDIQMYLLCLDSLFSYIASLKRIYRALDAVTPFSYNYPYTLLQALGFNRSAVQFLRQNKPQFLAYINSLIDRSTALVMPYQMSLFDRHYILNDNVFLDSPSPLSQLIVPRQDAFYLFSQTPPAHTQHTLNGGNTYLLFFNKEDTARCTAARAVNAPWAVSGVIGYASGEVRNPLVKLQQFGDMLLESLINSEDAHIINGYLMRVFGAVQAFSVGLLMPEEKVEPVYSEEMLAQFHNARVPSIMSDPTVQSAINLIPKDTEWSLDSSQQIVQTWYFDSYIDGPATHYGHPIIDTSVYQNPATNEVLSIPSAILFPFYANSKVFTITDGCGPYMNLDSVEPTVSEIVDAMRFHSLIVGGKFANTQNVALITIAGGTEIPTCWQLFTNTDGDSSEITAIGHNNVIPQTLNLNEANVSNFFASGKGTSAVTQLKTLRNVLATTAFNSFPLVRMYFGTLEEGKPESAEFLGDIKNFTTFEQSIFELINKYALMSLLSVFSI